MKKLLWLALVSIAIIILLSVVAVFVHFLIASSDQIQVTTESTSTTKMAAKLHKEEKLVTHSSA